MLKRAHVVLLFAAITAAAPLPAAAQQSVGSDLDQIMKRAAGERIVIAGRQRMLAEGMAAKLCYKVLGIEDDAARRELYAMWRIFSWYHAGLRDGNPQLKLVSEADPAVLTAWREMDMVWGGIDGLYAHVISSEKTDIGTFLTVLELTGTVTDAASQFVAAVRAAYADQLGPRGFGSALLIDLYERQRMLAQKIVKDVCLVSQPSGGAIEVTDLSETLRLFMVSMQAFETGMPDAGVPPPATPEIAGKLAAARAAWGPAQPYANTAAAGETLSTEDLAHFAVAMDLYISAMTGAINALVALKQN